jgi:predicted transcriptional regulator YdeE
MNITSVQPFNIIGIAVRTTNESNQAAQDIPALWQRFMEEHIIEQIPNKVDNTIYSVYTDYEKDHTRPYTTLLGCRVADLSNVPEGLTGKSFAGGQYTVFTAKGKITEGIVYNEWIKIWNADISRAYTADFEVYGANAQDPENAKIDIFIAMK